MDAEKIKEYNDIPVYYCKECLSLLINCEMEICDYCEKCHSGSIGVCHIDEWDKMFFEKYGYHFLEGEKTIYQKLLEKGAYNL